MNLDIFLLADPCKYCIEDTQSWLEVAGLDPVETKRKRQMAPEPCPSRMEWEETLEMVLMLPEINTKPHRNTTEDKR